MCSRTSISEEGNIVGYWPLLELENMVKKVDAFIVPVAWAPETNAIIDERIFRNMRQNSFIVNVARGECIDEKAL